MKKVLMFQGLLFLCASHIPQSHQLKIGGQNYKNNSCAKSASKVTTKCVNVPCFKPLKH